ncbi:MAG: MBL fold metallo-hydrolase [Clostridia bacterium]|nr:MBL fold metallo-hydrolase [Clostridia bacterium]
MTKGRIGWRRWSLILLSVVVLAACLAIELGSRLPASGIPGWTEIYRGLGLTPASAEGVLEVHFLSVGNADCILLRQGEQAALIDGGEPGDGERILDYLRRYGVEKLDFVLVSHGHDDHVGGLELVVSALPVERLLIGFLPPVDEQEPVYKALLVTAEKIAVPIETVQAGVKIRLGEAELCVVSALPAAKDENDRSVVARLTFGDRAFLFTGDAGKVVEEQLLKSETPLQADVLKIGHHGSKNSSSVAFLRRVAPAYAVISSGVGNVHNHPAEAVLQRLQELGITCLRNDVAGHVIFTTDGSALVVRTEQE